MTRIEIKSNFLKDRLREAFMGDSASGKTLLVGESNLQPSIDNFVSSKTKFCLPTKISKNKLLSGGLAN